DTAALRERNQRSARARERCPWHLRSMLCEAIEMMSHSVVPSSFIRVTPLSSVGAFAAPPLVSASACARARTRGNGGASCRGGSCTRCEGRSPRHPPHSLDELGLGFAALAHRHLARLDRDHDLVTTELGFHARDEDRKSTRLN